MANPVRVIQVFQPSFSALVGNSLGISGLEENQLKTIRSLTKPFQSSCWLPTNRALQSMSAWPWSSEFVQARESGQAPKYSSRSCFPNDSVFFPGERWGFFFFFFYNAYIFYRYERLDDQSSLPDVPWKREVGVGLTTAGMGWFSASWATLCGLLPAWCNPPEPQRHSLFSCLDLIKVL